MTVEPCSHPHPDGIIALLLPSEEPAHLVRVDRCPTGAGTSSTCACRTVWPETTRWTDTLEGQRFAWCGYRVDVTAKVDNQQAFALAARLDCAELADRIGLSGDLFLVGIGPEGTPADVPAVVLSAAERTGLLQASRSGVAPDDVASTRPCLRQVTTR